MSFIKGTLDILVLKALQWTPMHGFELTRWLAGRSGDALALDEAAVYQALYRLEGRRMITAEWGISDQGKRARFYALTPAGRAQLKRQISEWRSYAAVVATILDTNPA